MQKLLKRFFDKPQPAQMAEQDKPEREKLTKQEVMAHFDCQRFPGAGGELAQ